MPEHYWAWWVFLWNVSSLSAGKTSQIDYLVIFDSTSGRGKGKIIKMKFITALRLISFLTIRRTPSHTKVQQLGVKQAFPLGLAVVGLSVADWVGLLLACCWACSGTFSGTFSGRLSRDCCWACSGTFSRRCAVLMVLLQCANEWTATIVLWYRAVQTPKNSDSIWEIIYESKNCLVHEANVDE